VLVVKKIGASGNPELAVGALGPDEIAVWNWGILGSLGLKEKEMQLEIRNLQLEIRERRRKFGSKGMNLKDKTVILSDDGIATGATMEAAIAWIKKQNPASLVLAVPVAPPDIMEKFKNLVDEVVVLETPAFFGAVGQFYEEFPQVSDEEVTTILKSK
jgi:predicted phosphoribosyltransferase